MKRRQKKGDGMPVTHKSDTRNPTPAIAAHARATFIAAVEVSDQGDPNRPTIRAEKTLGKQVREALLKGGGTPAVRAEVAVGLIRARVEEAYGRNAA